MNGNGHIEYSLKKLINAINDLVLIERKHLEVTTEIKKLLDDRKIVINSP